MTLPLQAVHDPTSDQNFRQVGERFPIGIADLEKGILLQLATAGTARKVAFGSTSVTFSASKFSGEVQVTHGLGTTPLHIYVTSENAEITAGTRGYTSTQFTLQAGDWLEAITGTRTIHWLAIG